MNRKLFLSMVGFLPVTLLLIMSCGPKSPMSTQLPPPTSTSPSPAATQAPAPAVTPVLAPTTAALPATSQEKPKYGGTMNLVQAFDFANFVPGKVNASTQLAGIVNEQLTAGDRTKGPAGTRETSFGEFGGELNSARPGVISFEYVSGLLAESFETPEIGVWVLNIRRGVHWALNPEGEASRLVNGREMTADDIIWSINFQLNHPTAGTRRSQPGLAKNAIVEKTGPWQVTVRTPVDAGAAYNWIMGGGGIQYIWAKEVIEKYGDANNWRDMVGTGPFMITDFVPGSVATFKRNPNYWMKNPIGLGKGDQLPYADGVKVFIIPDLSTRLAAMRTARIDWLPDVEWEDAQGLLKTASDLQSYKFLPRSMMIGMRTDKTELPFKDKKVRQALMLATDFEAIKNDFYKGNAVILNWPARPTMGKGDIYVPLEQLPGSARTLFSYNPERARQLLAEAGYPNGFKTKIIVRNVTTDIDSVSIFKSMWAKVGVDLELQPRETAVYNSISTAGQEEMIFREVTDWSNVSQRYAFVGFCCSEQGGGYNASWVNAPPGKEPAIDAAFREVQKNIMINYPKADQITRDLIPYVLEQAYMIARPAPYSYRLWHPWLKDYYGESDSRYWIQYAWIDQDLKQSMTGRR